MSFPRGLIQPRDGYRFSVDALLLATFVQPRGELGLDLGAGCGVVGLGVLLRHAGVRMLGLEIQSTLARCAAANAKALGVDHRYATVIADVCHMPLPAESMDFVVVNPPYRRPEAGRQSPTWERRQARFENRASLDQFVAAACRVLRNRGSSWWIFLAERADELLALCRGARLQPKELLPVAPFSDAPARMVLLQAVKNGGFGLTIHPPLVLHEKGPMSRHVTASALAWCPWLA
jgi:tRNA1Val (adenine37-N6)-methyltransferase